MATTCSLPTILNPLSLALAMGEKEGDRDVVIEDNFEDRVKEEVGGKKVVDVKVDEAAADGF